MSLLQDLQTWTSAQASCNENAAGNLASVEDSTEWGAISSLLEDFWYNTTNPSTAMYQNFGPAYPQPYVGFNDTGLNIDFQGCAWIGECFNFMQYSTVGSRHAWSIWTKTIQ